jgi:H+/Na+-translocating ferredoxin:NAD+ oxidoreductase subunit G
MNNQGTSTTGIVGTLAIAGLLAGTLLVFVFQATQPTIQKHKAKMLRLAVEQVLQKPASYTAYYLVDDQLQEELPDGASAADFEQVFLGLDQSGKPLGYAVVHSRAGFQDQIKVIFGYRPDGDQMLGMKILESKETPGLGDKIESSAKFVDQFERVQLPLTGVKVGSGSGEIHQVDMITGATISSRAVIRIINEAYQQWNPILTRHAQELTP